MTHPRKIHVCLIHDAFNVVRERTGKPHTFVWDTYQKWQAGAAVGICKYGKEKAVALDCRCDGCIESLCYLFFDTVQNKITPPPLSPFTKGFSEK